MWMIAVLWLIGAGLAAVASPFSLSIMMDANVAPASGGQTTFHCDSGPDYVGAIPTPAAAAGLTHCFANLDFTSSALANINTWLDCFGASPALLDQFTFGFGGTVPSCTGRYEVIPDPISSVQVFHIHYPSTDCCGSDGGAFHDGNAVQSPFTLPLGFYVEQVSRVSAASFSACNNTGSPQCLAWDVWQASGAASGTPSSLETDFIEYNNVAQTTQTLYRVNGNVTAELGLIGSACCGTTSTYSGTTFSNYNTLGFRQTTDGSDIGNCAYVDNSIVPISTAARTLVKCNSMVTQGLTPTAFDLDNHQNTMFASCGAPSGSVHITLDCYVQRIVVWTCNNPTTNCTTGLFLN